MRIIRMLRLLRLAWKPRDFAREKTGAIFHRFFSWLVPQVVRTSPCLLFVVCTCNVNQPCGRVVI